LALVKIMNAAAYLIIIVNSANWNSSDVRITPFGGMDACRAALESMRVATTAAQSGDKSGMIATAYCSTSSLTYRYFDQSGKEQWR
jgi:hypothetical protein